MSVDSTEPYIITIDDESSKEQEDDNTIITNDNILVFSSLLFIANAVTAFIRGYYSYSFLFIILTITSVLVHSDKNNIIIRYLDKVAIYSIVIYGAYVLYNKINTKNLFKCFVAFITFVFCIYLYFYGFFSKTMCFSEDKFIGNIYHCVMHIIGSLGHQFIIFL
jgi:hypothetical protein